MGAPPPAAAANAGPPEQLTYFIDVRAELVGGSPVADVDDIVIRTNEEKDPKPTNKLDPALLAAVNGRDVMIGAHGFHVTRDFGIQYLHHWHQWLDLGPNGYFVGVLWPGDSKWLHGLDYPGEYGDAIKSGQLVADYVAAHECAHLLHPHHGPAFWAETRRLIGDERPHRAWLRAHGSDLHGFGA